MHVIELQEKTVKTTVTVRDDIICDKCGAKVEPYGFHDAYECEIKIKTGYSIPDGQNIKEHSVDLCEKCSGDFMILLERNGYRVNCEDGD